MAEPKSSQFSEQVIADAIQNLRIHGLHNIQAGSPLACYASCKVKTPLGFLFLNSIALVQGDKGDFYISFPSRKVENEPRGKDYFYMESEFKNILTKLVIEAYQANVSRIKEAADQHTKRLQS